MRPFHRGAPLPYRTLAGVIPCSSGWLAATAKLQGITIAAEEPQTFPAFRDVLDYKPAFQVIALFAPIGLLDESAPKGRTCEREARQLLGRPRSSAIVSAPARPVLGSSNFAEAVKRNGGHLNPISWKQLSRIAEVDGDIAPYWQRTVFEVHPELSFFQLNGNQPLRYSKHSAVGREERELLLSAKVPGFERITDIRLPRITAAQLLDATACLWTARRIISRAVTRLPEFPEWDSQGLRMEIVR